MQMSIARNLKRAFTLDVSNFDTSKVGQMQEMFYGCRYIKTLDLSSFDTSANLTNWMMFELCDSLGTCYARTAADRDFFNSTMDKPSNVNFIVKP